MTYAAPLEIQRAEHIDRMQKIFSENMVAFKKYLRPIYNFYLDYEPTCVSIDMDDNGFLNLKQNDAPIYPGDPKIAHKKQFELFLQNPRHFRFAPIIKPLKRVNHRQFLHSHFLSVIDELGQTANREAHEPDPRFIPTLVLLGVGMGYHLEMLTAHYDIRNLLIYEPNPDVFYAAMFLIRLTPILEHFTTGTNSITIKIDGTPSEFCNQVANLSVTRGTSNISRIYLYRHYNSMVTDEAFSQLHKIMHRLMQGWGFFEDEIISLNHTLINGKQPMRFIQNNVPNMGSHPLPAFIIANGPSLDRDIAYIKAHQDSAIIFSAGSTLFTLHKAGITPDFHVDIERTIGPKEACEHLPLSYREKIKLLTLNTTHPDMVALFPNHAFCLKANDTGTDIISEQIPSGFEDPLTHCNPLAGNGALAFALRLGFTDLVFFGLDMGSVDGTKHHASNSLYYTADHKYYRPGKRDDFKLERPCNRGGTMFTSELLDFSRYAIEAALHSLPGLKAQNCSVGLEIQGCSVTNNDALSYENNPNAKSAILHKIESERCHTFNDLYAQASTKMPTIKRQVAELSEQLIHCVRNPPTSAPSLLNMFAEQLHILERVETEQPIPTRMWLGTLRYLHCNTATWLIGLKQKDAATQAYIEASLHIMNRYLRAIPALYEIADEKPWSTYSPQAVLDDMKKGEES